MAKEYVLTFTVLSEDPGTLAEICEMLVNPFLAIPAMGANVSLSINGLAEDKEEKSSEVNHFYDFESAPCPHHNPFGKAFCPECIVDKQQ